MSSSSRGEPEVTAGEISASKSVASSCITSDIQAPTNTLFGGNNPIDSAIPEIIFASMNSQHGEPGRETKSSSESTITSPGRISISNPQALENSLLDSGIHTSAISHLLTTYNVPPELIYSTNFANTSSDDLLADGRKIEPVVTNIVCTANVGCELDLKRIVKWARNAEYRSQFVSVVMKIGEPKATSLVFANGKIVCMGTKSVNMAKIATRRFARIIQKLGFQARFLNFEIHNMVAACKVNFPIRIEALNQAHPHLSRYDPEVFNGLVYRMVKPQVNFLIFPSGKISLGGSKTNEEIHEAFGLLYPILLGFRGS